MVTIICKTCGKIRKISPSHLRKNSGIYCSKRCYHAARRTGITPRTKEQEMQRNLKRAYGITIEQKNFMFLSQNGKCAICGKVMKPYGRDGAHIDHDHKKIKLESCYALVAIGE